MRNIILVGLPGCGKSTLGEQAARIFQLDFLDMDAEIERRAGKTIPEIFAAEGEEGFRDRESAVARELSRRRGTVIAAGGGAVLREQNIQAFRENGLVVFIDRPPGHIARDVAVDFRPTLRGNAERIFTLGEQRRPLYLKYADVALLNDAGQQQAQERLHALVRSEYPPREGFAVIGDPIGHTLSPAIHRNVFAHLGIGAPYAAIHVPRGTVGAFAQRARTAGLAGFNVTIPHKRAIIAHLDEVDDLAARCGAVNTVVARDGHLFGYNTDMGGLLEALRACGYEYRGRHVALLGAGGAARGIAVKAAMERASRITVLGRRPEQAEALCGCVRDIAPEVVCQPGGMAPEALARSCANADILINATPLGMRGVDEDFTHFCDLSFLAALPFGALVCDLIYDPQKTSLLLEAERLGRKTMNGLGMLIQQALLADELFLGRKFDRAGLYEVAAAGLRD